MSKWSAYRKEIIRELGMTKKTLSREDFDKWISLREKFMRELGITIEHKYTYEDLEGLFNEGCEYQDDEDKDDDQDEDDEDEEDDNQDDEDDNQDDEDDEDDEEELYSTPNPNHYCYGHRRGIEHNNWVDDLLNN